MLWIGRRTLGYRDIRRASEFRPVPHEDKSFEKFGFFRIEREVLDPERGATDIKDYYATIWNIFENRYDANGNERPADTWDIKPITYYYIPTERLPSTQACPPPERPGWAGRCAGMGRGAPGAHGLGGRVGGGRGPAGQLPR